MVKAIDVAKYFLTLDKNHDVFNKNLVNREGRTFYEGNARLNKYMHLANNIYIAKYGRPLMDTVFYAYDNGAVVPEVQENYSALLNRKWSEPELPEEDKKYLNKIFKAFRNADLDELIELSHEDSEWIDKHDHYRKEDQRMDVMKHQEEYAEQYADMVKVLERMDA